jgi:hypothetical protein
MPRSVARTCSEQRLRRRTRGDRGVAWGPGAWALSPRSAPTRGGVRSRLGCVRAGGKGGAPADNNRASIVTITPLADPTSIKSITARREPKCNDQSSIPTNAGKHQLSTSEQNGYRHTQRTKGATITALAVTTSYQVRPAMPGLLRSSQEALGYSRVPRKRCSKLGSAPLKIAARTLRNTPASVCPTACAR